MGTLLDPFASSFMQRAWLELALLSVPAGVIGALVVLRRLAFATHALGVGTFPGVVLAVGVGFSPFLGGLAAALVLASLLVILTRGLDLDPGAVTGILLASALAVGSVLVSDVYAARARVDTLLFGSLIGVGDEEILLAAAVAVVAVAALAVFGRPWLATAFDAPHAVVLGARPGRDDGVLLSLLAVAVVVSVGAVGSLLVSALLVVPAATARLVTRRLASMVGVATGVSLVVSTVGLWLSYRTEAPPGATVAATAACTFGAVLAARGAVRRAGRRAVPALLAVALVATGCGGGADAGRAGDDGGRLRVVATTPLVADWARQVGGERVAVTRLLDAEADPHAFEPGPREAEAVADAALLLAVGGGLDAWAGDLVEGAGGAVDLVEVAPGDALRASGGGHADGHAEASDPDESDPHFWHDPRLARRAVQSIAAALAAADPAGAATYEAGAARYAAELVALDAELGRRYGSIPSERRKLVTNHDALGYLADRYGLEVVGTVIPSTSTAAEPNARDTAALIERIRALRVPAIFSESTVDPKLGRQVAAETGVSIYADLLGDTLAPDGEPGADYVGMMRRNADTIVEGLTR